MWYEFGIRFYGPDWDSPEMKKLVERVQEINKEGSEERQWTLLMAFMATLSVEAKQLLEAHMFVDDVYHSVKKPRKK